MAVRLEFFNLIVPMRNLRRISLDEMEQRVLRRELAEALRAPAPWLQDTCWHDGILFRAGAMGWDAIENFIDDLARRGLETYMERDGERYWNEVCGAVSGHGIALYPCDWAIYDRVQNAVHMSGEPAEPIVGPAVRAPTP